MMTSIEPILKVWQSDRDSLLKTLEEDAVACDCAKLLLLIAYLSDPSSVRTDRMEFEKMAIEISSSDDLDVVAGLFEICYALQSSGSLSLPSISDISGRLSRFSKSYALYMRAACIILYDKDKDIGKVSRLLDDASGEGLYTAEWLLHWMSYPNVKGFGRRPVVFFRRLQLWYRMVKGPKKSMGWQRTFWKMSTWVDTGMFYVKWKVGVLKEESRCRRTVYDHVIRRGLITGCLKSSENGRE